MRIRNAMGKLFSYALNPPMVVSVPIIPASVTKKSVPLQIQQGLAPAPRQRPVRPEGEGAGLPLARRIQAGGDRRQGKAVQAGGQGGGPGGGPGGVVPARFS